MTTRRIPRANKMEDGVARKHQPEDPWEDTTFRPIAYYNYETGENWSRLTEVIANGGRLNPYGKEGQHGTGKSGDQTRSRRAVADKRRA